MGGDARLPSGRGVQAVEVGTGGYGRNADCDLDLSLPVRARQTYIGAPLSHEA